MDVPNNINMDNWETNDNFLIGREENVGLLPSDGSMKSSILIEPGQTATEGYANVGLSQDVNRNDPHYTVVEQNTSLGQEHRPTQIIDTIKGYQSIPHNETDVSDIGKTVLVTENSISQSEDSISHRVPQTIVEQTIGLSHEHVTAIDEAVASSDLALTDDVGFADNVITTKDSISNFVTFKEPISAVETVSQMSEPVFHTNLVEENRILSGNSVFTGAFVAADNLDTESMVLEEFTSSNDRPMPTNLAGIEQQISTGRPTVPEPSRLTTDSCIITDTIINDEKMEAPIEKNQTIYETLETDSDFVVQTNSTSVPVSVNNGNIGDNISCIDLVLPVVDAASVTMPDPLSLRPSKVNTGRPTRDIDSMVKPREPSEGVIIAENSDSIPKLAKPNVASSSSYPIPLHLMGRSLENPGDDIGANVQKPRPGVKIPFRNLTSQIVTKDEIAQEYYDRSQKNFPVHDTPQGKDILFTNKLTKRLASHITPEKVEKSIKKTAKDKQLDTSSIPVPTIPAVPVLVTPVAVTKAVVPVVVPAPAVSAPVVPAPIVPSPAASVSVVSAPVVPTPVVPTHIVPIPVVPLSVVTVPVVPVRVVPVDVSQNSGDDELLAILEGEVDDWSIDRPPPQLIEAARSPIQIRNDPPKLDPMVERELALKQLSDMRPVKTKQKSKDIKTSHDTKISAYTPVRKRKFVEETAASEKTPRSIKQTAAVASNGESSSSNVEDEDGNKVVDKKAPRIFKTKKSLALTNGTGKILKNDSKLSVSPKKSTTPTHATSSEPAKETAVNSNKMPNKPNEKTVKSPKKSKNNETEASEAAKAILSPPRTYSSRIKKSTYSDDFVFPSTSKSRVVPIVGHSSTSTIKVAKVIKTPKTPVVKEIPQVPKDASLQTPVATVPRKRGRPRLIPLAVKVIKTEPEEFETPTVVKSGSKLSKKTPKKLSEIDRLLMDEGAINMLYSVERDEEERRTGAPVSDSPKKRVLKSTRYSHKDLLMKTRLVKSAVQRLKNTPEAESSPVSLRAKRASGIPTLTNQSITPQRKTSFDSNVSLQSPPSLTSMEPGSPTQIFTYPPRLRPPAEASRIIRRHSSSSNFSSRSTSPNPSRRLSIDAALSPQQHNNAETDDALASTSGAKKMRKRGAPIYITKLKSNLASSKTKKKKNADGSLDTSVEDSIFKPQQSATVKSKTQVVKVVKGKAAAPTASKVTKSLSTDSVKSVGKGKKEVKKELKACLAEAVTAFIAEDGNLDSSCVPPELSKEICPASPPSSPNTSISSGYSSLVKTLEVDCQRRAEESNKERSSPRQGVGLSHYKELSVRRHDNMVQVILAPVSTKTMNALNPQVLRELREVLAALRKDDTCRAVLVTATGSAFCTGVDFIGLVAERQDKRRAAAQEMAHAVRQFMVALSQFSKPIIAGVHGAAVGLGVTMLPFFDMVFASDKATFYTPYAKLGQVPEGAAVVTLPQLLGNAVTSELLYASRKLTASEALQYGLVTRILWPDKFQEELLTLVRTLANQSAQSMEATKALLRHSLRSRVDAVLESESQLLVQHWSSAECQANFKRFSDDEDIGLLRQRIDA